MGSPKQLTTDGRKQTSDHSSADLSPRETVHSRTKTYNLEPVADNLEVRSLMAPAKQGPADNKVSLGGHVGDPKCTKTHTPRMLILLAWTQNGLAWTRLGRGLDMAWTVLGHASGSLRTPLQATCLASAIARKSAGAPPGHLSSLGECAPALAL